MARSPSGRDGPATSRRSTVVFLLLLSGYVTLLSAYVGLRYAWHSQEGDAIRLTALSQNVLAEGVLSPAAGAYALGFGYPALNTFLAHVTGLPIEALQVGVQPFLVGLLVPLSYAAYRSLTGGRGVALLASLLLFLSPEFLYEATRSSHAKLTWLAALTMLLVLAHSFRSTGSLRRLAPWVASFYLVAFALISSNAFFASGYIVGIAFAFAASYLLFVLPRTRPFAPGQMRRLSYVTAASWLLVFLFIFYLYPPALRLSNTMQTVLDKLSMLFLNVDAASEGAATAYAYVQSTWIGTPVYLALTSFNWLMLILSFAVWLRKAWSLLVRREGLPPNELLLWLLYASFAGLMVVSLIVDRAGALSSNLQVRIFPHFLLVGIPLAAEGVVAFLRGARSGRLGRIGELAPAALVVLVAVFALAAMLKITNEPLLSNRWSFYSDAEHLAASWTGDHVRLNGVWIGGSIGLLSLAEELDWSNRDVWIDRSPTGQGSRYVLASDVAHNRADRMERALPDVREYQRVYDAGGAELYVSRPLTPYQR